MSILAEHKTWEGRVVDGQFPLQTPLGNSDHSVVFLTERRGEVPQKAAIKLLSVDAFRPGELSEDAQLGRWRDSARLSHPNLIRIFESGRATLDDRRFLYVVMEYAEENLGQILPQRALSSEEVAGMLPATAEALAYLHGAGFVHGRIKPSNVLAVNDQLKISLDGVGKPREQPAVKGAYDAPELNARGMQPPSDSWSLGTMLVVALTQKVPAALYQKNGVSEVTIPGSMAQPFQDIARHTLRVDPLQRWTMQDILGKLAGKEPAPKNISPTEAATSEKKNPAAAPPRIASQVIAAKQPEKKLAQPKTSFYRPAVIVPLLAVILLVIVMAIFVSRRSASQTSAPVNSSDTRSVQGNSALVPAAPVEPQAPLAVSGSARGKVRHQVEAEVSKGARSTISGHLKINVRVSVDAAGSVTDAIAIPPIPSQYFAGHSLNAAKQWEFDPPKLNGKPVPGAWILHFAFSRASQTVTSTETNLK